MFAIDTRDFKHAIIYHYHSERAKSNTWRYLDLIHVVDAKAARLFHPVFDEWISQGVFSFSFREVCTFDDETIFAHFLIYQGMSREVAGLTNEFKVCPCGASQSWLEYCERCQLYHRGALSAKRKQLTPLEVAIQRRLLF